MVAFKFPPFHAFAPSYTLQPVAATRAKQTTLWCDLIRAYCRHHCIFWLDTADTSISELFRNDAINRRLSDADIAHFLGALVNRGDGEWDASRQRVLVYWRRPAEWAELIFKWVEDTGQNGQVLTVHEIRKSDSSKGQGKCGRAADVLLNKRLTIVQSSTNSNSIPPCARCKLLKRKESAPLWKARSMTVWYVCTLLC